MVIKLTINHFFPSKFEAGFLLGTTKSMKSAMDLIKKFELDRKRLKRDGKRQIILTFLIKFKRKLEICQKGAGGLKFGNSPLPHISPARALVWIQTNNLTQCLDV